MKFSSSEVEPLGSVLKRRSLRVADFRDKHRRKRQAIQEIRRRLLLLIEGLDIKQPISIMCVLHMHKMDVEDYTRITFLAHSSPVKSKFASLIRVTVRQIDVKRHQVIGLFKNWISLLS